MDDYTNYKTWKKKELIAQIENLKEDLSDANFRWHGYKEAYESWMKSCDQHVDTINALRQENEQLTLTPQAKIDTEGAYQRGYQAARRNLRAWAVTAVTDLEAKLVVGDEKPPVKINPTLLNQDPR